MSDTKKVIMITGAGSGMGMEAALQLAQLGHAVYPTLRNIEKLSELESKASSLSLAMTAYQVDVTQPETISEAIIAILDKEGRIDVLINNAGFGQMGALERVTIAQMKEQLDTNLLGAIRCIQAVLPTMRSQNSGTIVNVSSLAGVIGFPYGSVYGMSKFALEGLSEGLAQEILAWNIKVRLVEPGPVITNFQTSTRAGTRVLASNPYEDQEKAVDEGLLKMMESSIAQTAEEAAKAIVDAATNDDASLFRFPTSDWVTERVKNKFVDPFELNAEQ